MLANPVTLRCSELFDSRTHAVIGISPFNSYFSEIRISELARWARAAGLTVEAMIGLTYNPITKHYRLVEGDVSVNYMIRASKPA